jgi:hypothetical protein
MFANKSLSLIIEDGYNTSYIDSLFVSMFYKPSYIQNILLDDVINLKFLHLQNMIDTYFVEKMRMGYVINSLTMNEIRNQLIFCGWKNESNIIEVFNVQELYDFIMNGFNKKQLMFKTTNENNIAINYISLNVSKNNDIKDLLNIWIDNNLSSYELKENPTFIPLYLNRINGEKYNESLIDIQEGIQLKKNNTNKEQHELMWKIHAITCFSKNERKYYSIIIHNKSWYLFKNSKLPSLMKINIDDEDFVYKIQKECVLLFYTLDTLKNK